MTIARMLTQEEDGIPGYMAHPEGPGRRPGILMVHHAHGVTADVHQCNLASDRARGNLISKLREGKLRIVLITFFPMLILGEVRTCLLHNSGPLPRNATTELLGLLSGQQVLFTERPIGRAVSPEMPVGVDCRLAAEFGYQDPGSCAGTFSTTVVLDEESSFPVRLDLDELLA